MRSPPKWLISAILPDFPHAAIDPTQHHPGSAAEVKSFAALPRYQAPDQTLCERARISDAQNIPPSAAPRDQAQPDADRLQLQPRRNRFATTKQLYPLNNDRWLQGCRFFE